MVKQSQGWRWAALAAACVFVAPAGADVYTWVDASGKLNVSNLKPPAGARVTAVAHEDPAAIARAEAARKAAQEAEVRALSERVADLERAAEQSSRGLPPPMFLASAPPLEPPPPQYTVTVMPQSTPDDVAPPYNGCAWAGCPLPLGPAYYGYGVPVVVVSNGGNRRGRMPHRPHHGFAPSPNPHAAPAMPMPTRIARRR